MADEQTKKETEENQSKASQVRDGDGNKPQELSLVESANSAAERLERIKEELRAENNRREELIARDRLGGRSAGAPQQTEPERDDDVTYAKKALRGIIGK